MWDSSWAGGTRGEVRYPRGHKTVLAFVIVLGQPPELDGSTSC